jgi:hypothetical protein
MRVMEIHEGMFQEIICQLVSRAMTRRKAGKVVEVGRRSVGWQGFRFVASIFLLIDFRKSTSQPSQPLFTSLENRDNQTLLCSVSKLL